MSWKKGFEFLRCVCGHDKAHHNTGEVLFDSKPIEIGCHGSAWIDGCRYDCKEFKVDNLEYLEKLSGH